jgi:hypothetical protein
MLQGSLMVLDFHDYPLAFVRWRDMEQYNRLKALNLIPNLEDTELVDTSPCELSYAASDGDPA